MAPSFEVVNKDKQLIFSFVVVLVINLFKVMGIGFRLTLALIAGIPGDRSEEIEMMPELRGWVSLPRDDV